jgi:hypothetical protein
MLRTRLAAVLSLLAFVLAAEKPAAAQKPTKGPDVDYPLQFTVSPPVRNMPQTHRSGPPKEVTRHHLPAKPKTGNVNDPVLQTGPPRPALSQGLQQWEGIGAGFPGFTVTSVPPDTNMAVGPNHIVQWVNNAFVIFNKLGAQVQAPIDDGTFWGALSTCSQLGGFSDPIVQYDRAADRWLVSEVAIPLLPPILGQFAQCFAVSTSSDPAGTYNMWAYGFGSDLNDYPKIGVWPDGYYVTWNMFQNANNFMGARTCSFNRSAMLTGAAAPSRVCFQLSTAFDSLLPSDLDGASTPPAGSPNFQMNIDTLGGVLHLWKFHVDYANLNNSSLTGPTSIAVAPFNAPCPTTQDCVPQPGTTASLDALGDRLMYRLAYRNFGDHESIVANHTVLASGVNTGVRWYEVRNPAGAPALYQQGSFAPDADYRWMASIAMDKSGNIGLGYSVSSPITFPSIRYTGWETGNPLGTMQAETSMVAGGGPQNGYNRWGDYSAMRIDPTDDCTFWYTTEYQAAPTDSANWNTRIGAFKFPSCGNQSVTPTTTALASSLNPSTYSQSVTFTATVTPQSGSVTPTGTVTFKDGAATLGSSALDASGVVTLSTSTLAAGSHSITAAYGGSASFGASTSPILIETVNQAATSTSLSSSLNPSTYGLTVTFTATVTPAATIGTVQFLDGATLLGNANLSGGQASFATANLSAGGHSITAKYNGNSSYLGSTSPAVAQTVNQNATSTTLTSSTNPSDLGQPVMFTATVAASVGAVKPSSTVNFLDGATLLGSSALNASGVATFTTSSLSAGVHSITAQYTGNANFIGSTSAPLTQTVNNSVNTTTTLKSSVNPSVTGQTVTFTATVSPSSATGTVQFFDGAQSLGTLPLSGGTATFTTSSLSQGKHSITAKYLGDTNDNPSTSAVLTQTVRRRQ